MLPNEKANGIAFTRKNPRVAFDAYAYTIDALNLDHATAGSKAQWLKQTLGFTQANAGDLAKQIVFNPNTAIQTEVTKHGILYNQVISIIGANGRVIDVTFAWIKNNDGIIRLVTVIPTKQ